MLFELSSMNKFNIGKSIFLNSPKYSYSKLGNIEIENFTSPNGASSTSKSSRESFLKAHSETIERRSLMLPKKTIFNLTELNKTESQSSLFNYSSSGYYISDTTGTSVNRSTDQILYKALSELFEKNALFLLWYGKECFIINNIDIKVKKTYLYLYYINKGFKISLLYNDYFPEINMTVAIIHDESRILTIGVGTSNTIYESICNSLEESYSLYMQDITNYLFKNNMIDFDKKSTKYLLSIIEESSIINYLALDKNITQKSYINLMENRPVFIKNMEIAYLDCNVNSSLIGVKVFSKYMFNHVPFKENLNLNNPFNKNTLNISDSDLNRIPECIIK